MFAQRILALQCLRLISNTRKPVTLNGTRCELVGRDHNHREAETELLADQRGVVPRLVCGSRCVILGEDRQVGVTAWPVVTARHTAVDPGRANGIAGVQRCPKLFESLLPSLALHGKEFAQRLCKGMLGGQFKELTVPHSQTSNNPGLDERSQRQTQPLVGEPGCFKHLPWRKRPSVQAQLAEDSHMRAGRENVAQQNFVLDNQSS